MGKTGGHKKKSNKTGTQKKSLKLGAKEHRATAGLREKGAKEVERLLSPEAQQFLDQFKTGEGQIGAIKNANELLQPILQGQNQAALHEFDQSTLPQLQGQYGRGGRSSAFNQALSSARANLSNQFHQRSQELGLQYGMNMAQSQQQAAQQQWQNQFNASQAAQGAGLNQAQLNAQTDMSVYHPKGTPVLSQIAVAGAEGLGRGIAAGATGGASEVAPIVGKIATETNNLR